MDEIDKKILALLEKNARISFSELSGEIGLSKTPCWNRVKELQTSGVIKQFKTEIEPRALSLNIQAVVHLVVSFNQSNLFESAVIEHSNILNCFAVTGDFDYVLLVIAHDISDLDVFLRKQLSQFPGVERFSTAIATRTIKEGSALLDIK